MLLTCIILAACGIWSCASEGCLSLVSSHAILVVQLERVSSRCFLLFSMCMGVHRRNCSTKIGIDDMFLFY